MPAASCVYSCVDLLDGVMSADVHTDFYAFWADGDPDALSVSRPYFADRDGRVFELPCEMEGEFARPAARGRPQ